MKITKKEIKEMYELIIAEQKHHFSREFSTNRDEQLYEQVKSEMLNYDAKKPTKKEVINSVYNNCND